MFKAGIQVRVGITAPESFPWAFRPMRERQGPSTWESDPNKPNYGQGSRVSTSPKDRQIDNIGLTAL